MPACHLNVNRSRPLGEDPFLRLYMARCRAEKLPVDGDVLIALVVDVDDDDIALAREDGRAGELAVHGKDGLLLAEPSVVTLLNL